ALVGLGLRLVVRIERVVLRDELGLLLLETRVTLIVRHRRSPLPAARPSGVRAPGLSVVREKKRSRDERTRFAANPISARIHRVPRARVARSELQSARV